MKMRFFLELGLLDFTPILNFHIDMVAEEGPAQLH